MNLRSKKRQPFQLAGRNHEIYVCAISMNNSFIREHAPPTGEIWFLRDAVPVALMERFDLGKISSVKTNEIKEKLFARGGPVAWTKTVAECRTAMDELLAISMRDILAGAVPVGESLAEIGVVIGRGSQWSFSRSGVLDIFHQGALVAQWPFDLDLRLEILRRENRSLLLSVSVTISHEKQIVIEARRQECWLRVN